MPHTACRSAGYGVAIAGAVAVVAGIVGIAPAHADFDSYIKKLHDAGIKTPRDEYELKEWGYEVCFLRARGKPPRQWAEQAVYNSQDHPPYGLTEDQANFIVDTAVSDLCDDRDGAAIPAPLTPPY